MQLKNALTVVDIAQQLVYSGCLSRAARKDMGLYHDGHRP